MRALSILLTLVASAIAFDADASETEPTLVLQLASGRQFSGALDAASSPEQLVLRAGTGGITIRRPIRWERIASATIDGEAVTVERLREMAGQESGIEGRESEVRGQESGVRSQESGVRSQESARPREIRLPPMPDAEPFVAPEVIAVPALRRVTSLTFDARIANWDGDVEQDGLLLDLAPLDGGGYVVPASGTVEVELFAPQRRVFHHAPLSGGDTLELVERWRRPIETLDYGPHGVRLKLPFGAVHPELDTDWVASHYGLVHVRLAAPGHGVFDDSLDGIRIRPWAPNRDNLELNTGRRFVPTERLGRRD